MTSPGKSIEDLERFYQLSIDMLGVADFEGYFKSLSAAWERVLGFSRGELFARPFIEFVHPDDREATEAKAAELVAGKPAVFFENRYQCRDGSFRWLEWNSTPYVEERLIYFVARDVTERRAMQEGQAEAEANLRAKLEQVERQQRVISALSTPIIEVWDKVLTLPMLGVVDSMRAAEVMESLLAQVSLKGARFAILDLTGVQAMDTSTASHLLKLIQAIRLLGAEGIITGIQPAVAQTIVALGVDMEDTVTLANLRDALRLCMARLRKEAPQKGEPPTSGGGP